VQVFLTLLVGAILLGGCTAKPTAGETTANAAKPTISDGSNGITRQSSAVLPASENYERAVADYTNCVHEHTANLAACEKQRAIMDGLGKISSRSPGQSYTLGNTQIDATGIPQSANSANTAQPTSSQPPARITQTPQGSSQTAAPISLAPPPNTSQ
jgi:hypothetical protein